MAKILIISSLYPNKENSIRGIFVKKQVEELKRRNEVKVFATEISKSNFYEEFVDDGVDIYYTKYSFPKFVFSPYFYKKAMKNNLINLIAKFKPDVIHIHDYKHVPELYVLSKLLNFSQHNVVVTLHNEKQIAENQGFTRFYYNYTFKKVIDRLPKIIVVSNKVKRIIAGFCQNPKKIVVIGNGVEFNFPKIDKNMLQSYLPKNNEVFQIISVGNLVKTKGFDLLISAVTEINKLGEDVNLSIIGDGVEKENLLKLIVENKMESKIRLLGSIEHDIVMNLYQYYDTFVLPSWSETFGIVYLEAMLAKIPVIGVKGEGIDGIIVDEKNGFLVEAKDVNDLIEKVKKLMIKSLRDRFIEESTKVIQKYKLTNIVKSIEKQYE